jgi:hypothetical protein
MAGLTGGPAPPGLTCPPLSYQPPPPPENDSSQGQNLALRVVYVPSLLDRGDAHNTSRALLCTAQ